REGRLALVAEDHRRRRVRPAASRYAHFVLARGRSDRAAASRADSGQRRLVRRAAERRSSAVAGLPSESRLEARRIPTKRSAVAALAPQLRRLSISAGVFRLPGAL